MIPSSWAGCGSSAARAATGDFKLPTFELSDAAGGSAIPFATIGSLRLQEGQMVEIPIARKVTPGAYQLRIKTVEAPPQSAWLDAPYLTLSSFPVGAGQLVYFGTLEVEIRCQRWERQSAVHSVSHSVRDDFFEEVTLFKEDFPEVYQLYKDKVIQKMEAE